MRDWGSEYDSGSVGSGDELFSRLFSRERLSVAEVVEGWASGEEAEAADKHPPEKALRAYAAGRLAPDWPDPEELLQGRGGGAGSWGYRRISVHVLQCGRCRDRLQLFLLRSTRTRRRVGALGGLRRWLQEAAQPVPRPALATIAVQSLVIVGLVGLLLWQPAPVFRSTIGVDTGSPQPPSAVDRDERSVQEPAPPAAPTPELGEAQNPPEPEAPLADLPLPEEASYPPEVQQAIQTVQSVPDPDARLSALRILQRYPDPLLVEHLGWLFERETHPRVREEMARTMLFILSRTDRGLSGAVRVFEKLRRQAPDLPWFQEFQQEFAEMQKLLTERLQIRIEVHTQRWLRCTAPEDLTLGRLQTILSDLGGTIVLDSSTLAARRFRLQLPASPESAEALSLQRLEGLGIVCEE